MTDWLVRHLVRDWESTEDPAVRERYGILAGGVGIALNLLLSLGKLFAGMLTGSIAVTADAFNNLSDAGSSVVTLVGFKLAGQKADDSLWPRPGRVSGGPAGEPDDPAGGGGAGQDLH